MRILNVDLVDLSEKLDKRIEMVHNQDRMTALTNGHDECAIDYHNEAAKTRRVVRRWPR